MKIYADYLRKSVEQVGPTLTDHTDIRTAENLLDLLTPELVTEGMRLDLGKNPERLAFFNKLLSLQAGVRDGALHINNVISHHGNSTRYSGRMTPVAARHSLIDGLMYAQSTSWIDFQYQSPQRESSVIYSKLMIAEPTWVDGEKRSDLDQPFISVDGRFKYGPTRRAVFREFSRTLIDSDTPKKGADLTSKLDFGHSSFAAFALERRIENEGRDVVPELPQPNLSLSIGKPLLNWMSGAYSIEHERTYSIRNGTFVERPSEIVYEEDQAS